MNAPLTPFKAEQKSGFGILPKNGNWIIFQFVLLVIKELSLSYLVIGNYLVLVKSDFDMVISGEPYLALIPDPVMLC